MTYFDDFKALSQLNGTNKAQINTSIAQQTFDKYFLETIDKVSGTIDGISKEFVLQHLKYGENFNDEKLMLTENTTFISIGSKVVWDGLAWLVLNSENRAIKTHKAHKIHLCNNFLKWKDSINTTYVEDGVIIDSVIGDADSNNQVPLGRDRYEMFIQDNATTRTLYENQRFIFGNRFPYKITVVSNVLRPSNDVNIGLLQLRLELDQLNPLDDLANNIAYNGEVTPQPVLSNGVIFSQESLTISKYITKSVDVYNYVNSVADGTTFTFRIDSIPISAYEILSSTSNSISIKCKSGYHEGLLVAITDVTLVETSIPLILKN